MGNDSGFGRVNAQPTEMRDDRGPLKKKAAAKAPLRLLDEELTLGIAYTPTGMRILQNEDKYAGSWRI